MLRGYNILQSCVYFDLYCDNTNQNMSIIYRKMPKLVSYNTSYVNDCHPSQFNPFMSESSSILAKAIKIYNSKHKESPITLTYDNDLNKNLSTDYNNLVSDSDIGVYLKILRLKMSLRNTAYLNNLLKNDVDFISLIEQINHVGPDNHSYCDTFLNNKLDLKNENEQFGILYRLKQMPSVEDIDEPSRNNEQFYKYACVYDTIVNCQGQMPNKPQNLSSVAEGISIIYKKSIFGKNPILAVWGKKSSGSIKKLKLLNEDEFNKITDRDVHYYSDDSGLSICYDKTVDFETDLKTQKDKLKFVTGRETPDGGRPIIMTAGFNNDTKSLIILVAIHGPNIPNLFAKGTDLNDPINQLKNRFDIEIDALFDQVRTSISEFIDNGINEIKNKSEFTKIENVEVYLGGDFNDSRGLILKSLISKKALNEEDNINKTFGLSLTFELDGYKAKPVLFSGYQDLTKLDNINEPTDAIKQTQGMYKSLYSCCSNGDSLNAEKRTDGEILNKQGNGVFDENHLLNFSTFSPNMKNLEFVDPHNFGYNGDYALYGTNNTEFINTLQYMVLDPDPILKVSDLVYSSDHLPVISSTDKTQISGFGGRRRSNSCRSLKHKNLKRHTKKCLPKKHRSSRHKRRAHTYKKH